MTKEEYSEYTKNYFSERPALLHFGERFVKYVFDPSIKRFIDAYDNKGNPRFAKAIQKYVQTFSEEQKESLKELTKSIVYDSLSAMLDLFVLSPELSITIEQEGEKLDLLQMSDSFCTDILGEEGCIDLFSRYSDAK